MSISTTRCVAKSRSSLTTKVMGVPTRPPPCGHVPIRALCLVSSAAPRQPKGLCLPEAPDWQTPLRKRIPTPRSSVSARPSQSALPARLYTRQRVAGFAPYPESYYPSATGRYVSFRSPSLLSILAIHPHTLSLHNIIALSILPPSILPPLLQAVDLLAHRQREVGEYNA